MGKSHSTESAGFLLSSLGLLVLLTGLILAAWFGLTMLAIVLGITLAAGSLTRLWSHYCLAGVSSQRILSEHRVFPGESVELKLCLVNHKLLPLPWIQVEDELPLGFSPEILATSESRLGFGFLSKSTALSWYSRVTWKSTLQCPKRGYYRLGPVKITSGDIFGFYPRSIVEEGIDHLVVYPSMFSVEHLAVPLLYPLGNTRAWRYIFEDPTRMMGVRDYQPGDSIRRIHWKATARRQNLQVKVLEPTTTLDVVIFLAVDSFRHDTMADENFEYAISAAASLARYIIEHGNPVGLFLNSKLADSGQPAKILPGSTSLQLLIILESLAKVTHNPSSTLEQFLSAERINLPYGTTLIFLLEELTPQLKSVFEELRKTGYRILAYRIDRQQMEPVNDISFTAPSEPVKVS